MESKIIKTDALFHFIEEYRSSLMGISIISVVLYHLCTLFPNYLPLKVFVLGSIGVDIFIFLSALGLNYSLQKYDIITFYKRRLLRVYPLFIVKVILYTFTLYFTRGESFNTWDLFCNISGLSFFECGGMIIDWYIPGLIMLYMAFPLVRKYVIHNTWGIFLFTLFFSHAFCLLFDVSWQYDCLIARLPIYVLGIIAWKTNVRKPFFTQCFLLLCFSLIMAKFNWSRNFMTAGLTPILLLLFYSLRHIISKIWIFKVIGKYTLEIYLANGWSLLVINDYFQHTNILLASIIYITLQIIFSFVMIYLNKTIKKLILI